jgi:hypothetical protein
LQRGQLEVKVACFTAAPSVVQLATAFEHGQGASDALIAALTREQRLAELATGHGIAALTVFTQAMLLRCFIRRERRGSGTACDADHRERENEPPQWPAHDPRELIESMRSAPVIQRAFPNVRQSVSY